MGKAFHFVKETSNKHKIKVFLISLTILLIILGAIITLVLTFGQLFSTVPQLSSIKEALTIQVTQFTPAGLFYTGLAGGLFFIPLPQEAFYYYGLLKGNSIYLSLLTLLSGYLIAQVINYLLGSKLNRFFLHFVSKRKMYKAKRFITKHGGLGVFIFNFLPLPAPVLTFAIGIAKYNKYRLIFFTLLGILLKYAVITLFFFIFH